MNTTLRKVGLTAFVAACFCGLAGYGLGAELRVGTCQFPVSGDVVANGEWIRRQMSEAKALGADIVHFPETALSGYVAADWI